jgi:3-hydroxyethyl bacteriochlorophyllide a dehydrogenase
MKTRALIATGVDRVELVETAIPEPGPRQIVVESIFTAISPGTEMRCLSGRQPGGVFPFIMGYSLVGRVIARGEGAGLPDGTLVFCKGTERAGLPVLWGAHMAHAVCGEDRAFVLPDSVAPLGAALTKLAAIAYRGVCCAKTREHDEVAVVGLGPIGQLAARMHALAGCRVVAADLSPDRVAIAKAAGIEAVVAADGLVSAFGKLQPRGADVVVDSTGAASVLQQSVLLGKAKPWDETETEPTRLVIQGSYAENVVFDYHQAFGRELSVHFPRDNQAKDIRAVIGLLASGRLNTLDLVSEQCDPKEAQRVYSELRASRAGLLTAAFRWS